jgi:4-amino-4-deoxy-L-arabinose transferase-like glycosyltransferase
VKTLANRTTAYVLLVFVAGVLFLPNLGSHGLWDIDEAHNAECAREMYESNDWIVPTFNYKLRTDKPVLIYWCIMTSYSVFGVNEVAARLPSVLAGMLSVLLCYELGRRLFGALTGLLAGLILASSFMFCVSSHAVTPDALLILTVQGILLAFVLAYDRRQPYWLLVAGICAGLAMLAKGPVGVVLPGAAIVGFLLWQRDLSFLWHRATLQAFGLACLVALPWYILVGLETRWFFHAGFFLTHNVSRFNAPMEGHRGPFFYHLVVILAAYAPWSIFLGATLWRGMRPAARSDEPQTWAYRFLGCWIGVWFIVFSIAATKLPNYVLPTYPALALLTAQLLSRWLQAAWAHSVIRLDGERPTVMPAWVWRVSLGCLVLLGLGLAAGFAIWTGRVHLPQLEGRTLPDASVMLPLAAIPLCFGLLIWRAWARRQVGWGLALLVVGNTLLTAGLGAFVPPAADRERAVRPLAHVLNDLVGNHDVRIGMHPEYYRPSLVFYVRREIVRCITERDALELLRSPLQTYLLVPARDWPRLADQVDGKYAIIAQHRDLTLGQDVLLVSNQAAQRTSR